MNSADKSREVAKAPYSNLMNRKTMVDTTKVVAYQAADKYVNALMEDGKSHLLDTTIKALHEFNPHMVEVCRGAIVIIEKVIQVEGTSRDSNFQMLLVGGWSVTSSRRQYAKLRERFPRPIGMSRKPREIKAPLG